MDSIFWLIGYITVMAFALSCACGLVFLSYVLANMILESVGKIGMAVRSTRSWLAWKRWDRRYRSRKKIVNK